MPRVRKPKSFVEPEVDILREVIHEVLRSMVEKPGELRYFFAPKFCTMFTSLTRTLKDYILSTLRHIFGVNLQIGVAGDCLYILNYDLALCTGFLHHSDTCNVIQRLRTGWKLEKDIGDRFAVGIPLPGKETDMFTALSRESHTYQALLVPRPDEAVLAEYAHLFVPPKKRKANGTLSRPLKVLIDDLSEQTNVEAAPLAMTPEPAPLAMTPEPSLHATTPEPAPLAMTPEPVPLAMIPEPVPLAMTPESAPLATTPAPTLEDVRVIVSEILCEMMDRIDLDARVERINSLLSQEFGDFECDAHQLDFDMQTVFSEPSTC